MTYKITQAQLDHIERLKTFHNDCCEFVDWEKKVKEPFSKNELGPKERYWNDKEKRYTPNMISNLSGFSKITIKYLEYRRIKGKKEDLLLYKNWEEDYPFVKQILACDPEAWRKAIREYASFHKNREIAKAYSLYVYNDYVVECDLYLHNLNEKIPSFLEKRTAKRGLIRYHKFPETKRKELYEIYVYSCLNKVVNDLLRVLPCQTIFLNGILKNHNGHYPILSLVIEREEHKQYQCPKDTMTRHRQMVNFKKRSGFGEINRVYSPNILFKNGVIKKWN